MNKVINENALGMVNRQRRIQNVFVTGAAGYIGGSVAHQLLRYGYKVTGLVRTEEQAALVAEIGIDPIVGTLDDADLLIDSAQAADAVIHTADADHMLSAVTLTLALEWSGKVLLTTSGSGIVADHADGEFAAGSFLSEDDYFEPVPHRKQRVQINRFVRRAAIDKGVRTVVICPSMIYGKGKGIQPHSDQLPKLIELSRQLGAGVYFGKGLNRYSNVHIDDVVDLYVLAMEKAPGGSIFYAENGHSSFREIAEMISDHLGFSGKTMSLDVAQLISEYGEYARLGIASNSLVNAANAVRLGWSPKSASVRAHFSEIQ